MEARLAILIFYAPIVSIITNACTTQNDFYSHYPIGKDCSDYDTGINSTDLEECKCQCRALPRCRSVVQRSDGKCVLKSHGCSLAQTSDATGYQTYNRWGVVELDGLKAIQVVKTSATMFESIHKSNPTSVLDGTESGSWTEGSCVVSTSKVGTTMWWSVKFTNTETVYAIRIKIRDDGRHNRLRDFNVTVDGVSCFNYTGILPRSDDWKRPLFCETPVTGSSVNVSQLLRVNDSALQFCEISILMRDLSKALAALTTTSAPTTTTSAPTTPTTTTTAPTTLTTTSEPTPAPPRGTWHTRACTSSPHILLKVVGNQRSQLDCTARCLEESSCESSRYNTGSCTLYKGKCTEGTGGWAKP